MDIHTEENEAVWEKAAMYMGFYGACYTGPELKNAFDSAMAEHCATADSGKKKIMKSGMLRM